MSFQDIKVAVLGACGSIGQPLSMLLKMNPLVQELAMYDIQYPQGPALDLAHVPTKCSVTGYGVGQLADAVRDAQVVRIPNKFSYKRPQCPHLNLFRLFVQQDPQESRVWPETNNLDSTLKSSRNWQNIAPL